MRIIILSVLLLGNFIFSFKTAFVTHKDFSFFFIVSVFFYCSFYDFAIVNYISYSERLRKIVSNYHIEVICSYQRSYTNKSNQR